MDNDLKVVEVKRKLMQALGGVNEVYEKAKISSFQVKSQLLSILRRLQTTPVSTTEAKAVFRAVVESLNRVIKNMESDPELKRMSQDNFREWLSMPIKYTRLALTLLSIW